MGKSQRRKRQGPVDKDACILCFSNRIDEFKLGEMMETDGVRCHYYCLLFACGLNQEGEDDEGILGFLISDIQKEIRRGQLLRCSFCKRNGATSACCVKSCRVIFHLPCGLQNKTLHKFVDDFPSYCAKHRPKQNSSVPVSEECAICFGDMNRECPFDVLLSPCCSRWFHRDCVQKQALSAGFHYFRCPLCNDVNNFVKEMETFGIYIPEKDASWELDEDAFRELQEQYSKCDAESCLCPEGRDFDVEDTDWDVVVCALCASQGCHVKCGNIHANDLQSWTCSTCSAIQRKRKNNEQELVEPGAKRLHVTNEEVKHTIPGNSQEIEVIEAQGSPDTKQTNDKDVPCCDHNGKSDCRPSQMISTNIGQHVCKHCGDKVIQPFDT